MTKPISNIAGKSRSNITSSSNPAETGTDHEPHGLAQPIELVASTEQTAIHRPSFVTSIDLLKAFRLPDPAAVLKLATINLAQKTATGAKLIGVKGLPQLRGYPFPGERSRRGNFVRWSRCYGSYQVDETRRWIETMVRHLPKR
ncbi:hypothetical protein [Rhizobium sp. SG570]|uniref:hypothetical protein n=1 Tax=Rhizobium sp. SG570 TaxID=2587113 RepID=UPI00144545DC|nr:hypothetical protein [Rhizobium sp. SG570]NKJ35116.1 hypothetical protein [Rhizobium sp. SG570]